MARATQAGSGRPLPLLGLTPPHRKSTYLINFSMAEQQQTRPIEVPVALSQLVAVNVEYRVLLCLSRGCRKAVSPAGIVEHLRKIHKETPQVRKQVQEFIKGIPWKYDYSTVPLPIDGLAPQPIVPIVDGFHCQQCPFRNHSRKAMKVHGNKEHGCKRIADDELFQPVRLQSWFQDGKERYWVVDESQQVAQERQARRAAIQDAGEESDNSGANANNSSDGEHGQGEIDDQIVQEIENWKGEARERRLRLLKDVPVVEMDSWLQYTKWNEVLSQSKHNLVKTFQYTRMPDPDEPGLDRVLRVWHRIFDRCLDTLEATDHKDALKWWASPKNDAASQRPFELPQNAKSIKKYSEIWECFICYMIRTAPASHHEDETGRLVRVS